MSKRQLPPSVVERCAVVMEHSAVLIYRGSGTNACSTGLTEVKCG